MEPYTFHPISEQAILVQFTGNNDDTTLLPTIHHLTQTLLNENISGIIDIVPGLQSLAVYYNPLQHNYYEMTKLLTPFLEDPILSSDENRQIVTIPVCYDTAYGLDLHELSLQHSLSIDEIIHLHTSNTYTVAIMGFLPGFPYLIGLDKTLWTPRKSTPRTHVPKGAVGIGGAYTGIYSLPSPGGWNIIGMTPLSLFDNKRDKPFTLQPGDMVRFKATSKAEFDHIKLEGAE